MVITLMTPFFLSVQKIIKSLKLDTWNSIIWQLKDLRTMIKIKLIEGGCSN